MTTEKETHQQPNQKTHKKLKKDIKDSCKVINELLNKIDKSSNEEAINELSNKIGKDNTKDIIQCVKAELDLRRLLDKDKNKKNKYEAFFSLTNTKNTLNGKLNKIKEKHDDLCQQINKLKNPPNLKWINFVFPQKNSSDKTQDCIEKIEKIVDKINKLKDGNLGNNKLIEILDKILINIHKIDPLDRLNSNLQSAINLYATHIVSVKTGGIAVIPSSEIDEANETNDQKQLFGNINVLSQSSNSFTPTPDTVSNNSAPSSSLTNQDIPHIANPVGITTDCSFIKW